MLDLLRETLVVLAAQASADFEDASEDASDFKCRDYVQRIFTPIQDSTIPYAMEPPEGDIFQYSKQWIFLPAPEDGALRIPVLNVLWDPGEPPVISFQLACFYARRTRTPVARAWRFESPEGDGDSIHGFYHVQPSNRLRTKRHGDVAVPPLGEEDPQGAPTFPLDAADPVDLLVCMLIALYGLQEARRLLSEAGDPRVLNRMTDLRSVPR